VVGKGFVGARGSTILTGAGEPIALRGVCVGGWMNLENYITGHPATEQLVRKALLRVLGPDRYDVLFDRFLDAFYSEEDAVFIASLGCNCVRLPVNYRHFEDDEHPFVLKPEGFRHLDRAIAAGARHGIYSIIDLHSAQGYQNHHWHCDNPTTMPLLWDHPHFQDRVAWLWEQIAERYRDDPWVAGYNLLNEPADEDGLTVGPLYRRIVDAIRRVDPDHLVFLDGNTYGQEFEVLGGTIPGAVYAVHQYPDIGRAGAGPYPGTVDGVRWDRVAVQRQFDDRVAYLRRNDVPIWVGEFGMMYEGDAPLDASRLALVRDQLDIYNQAGASWTIWTYKDIGVRGPVYATPDSPWMRRLRPVLEKKWRLAVDHSGVPAANAQEYMGPIEAVLHREFPDARSYPFGLVPHARHIVRSKLVAEQLVDEFAVLFEGLDEDALAELADSFRLDRCKRREDLIDVLSDASRVDSPG
jgi:endoglucanase